jgi:transposase IS4-like protein
MNTHFQEVSMKLWEPGTDLTVDEIIVPYDGRSKMKTHIPGKPNPDGIKL